MTSRRALALGRRLFAGALSTPAFNAATPAPGVRRVRGLSAHAEVVSTRSARATGRSGRSLARAGVTAPPGNGNRVLVSTLPLSAAGGQPVDLSLNATSGGFVSNNALVPVSVAQQLQGGVTFPTAGFGFALQASGSAQPIATSSGVFFGNVGGAANATDFEVNAVPSGVESFLQIRAASSPQSYVLHFNLPAGAHLEVAQTNHPIAHDPPTAIEIAQGNTALGYVYQPSAVDATGAPIPSHATIQGANAVLSVSDQGSGVQFPVLLDPLVTAAASGVCDNNVNSYGAPTWAGWGFEEWDSYFNPALQYWFGEAIDNCAYYGGLYESMPTGNQFNAGNYADFYYNAPAGSYIDQVVWGQAYNVPYANSDLYSYLYVPSLNAFEPNQANYNGYWTNGYGVYSQLILNQTLELCYTTACTIPTGDDQNKAALGISATQYEYTGGNRAIVAAGSASVLLGDDHSPTIAGSIPASTNGWINDNNKTYTGMLTFQDVGLGLGSATYPGPNGASTTWTSTTCGNPYVQPCAPSVYDPYSYTLPEGITTLKASATDITGNQSPVQTSTMYIDRTAPTISLSGPLYDAQEAGTTVGGGSVTLGVDATDTDANEDGAPTSGVVSLTLRIDGQDPTPATDDLNQNCPRASCDMTATFPVDTTQLTAGSHTFAVTAKDGAGNVSSNSVTVTVNPTGPLPQSDTITPAPLSVNLSSAVSQVLSIVQNAASNIIAPAGLENTGVGQFQPALTTSTGGSGGYGVVGSDGQAQISSTSGSGFSIATGWGNATFTPVGASVTSVPGAVVSSSAVLFANISQDLSTILRPTALGVAPYTVIGAADAPETSSWSVAVADGDALQQLSDGSVAILANPNAQNDVTSTTPPDTAQGERLARRRTRTRTRSCQQRAEPDVQLVSPAGSERQCQCRTSTHHLHHGSFRPLKSQRGAESRQYSLPDRPRVGRYRGPLGR